MRHQQQSKAPGSSDARGAFGVPEASEPAGPGADDSDGIESARGPRMLRVKVVARRYDVSPATIYRAIESGHLVALKHGSGKGALRVPETALAAYERVCLLLARGDQPAPWGERSHE